MQRLNAFFVVFLLAADDQIGLELQYAFHRKILGSSDPFDVPDCLRWMDTETGASYDALFQSQVDERFGQARNQRNNAFWHLRMIQFWTEQDRHLRPER